MENKSILRVEQAITQLQQGGLIVIADDESREAEGDLVGLAEHVTSATVNTMVTKARGLLCVPMSSDYSQRLGLVPMVANETEPFGTAFTISIDAKTTSTGISAADRARTIRKLADPQATFNDFYQPGHVFPLGAKPHGVLQRSGHTEAAIDLAKLAGAVPVAYICEIMKKNGEMARRHDLKALAEGMKLPLITIQDIRNYRYLKNIDVVQSVTKVDLPTKYGHFKLEAFSTYDDQEPTLLITKGKLDFKQPLLLRLHSECLTGDVFGSRRCDCGEQLETSLKKLEKNGHGALLYLRQEGRGIGLANKLRAYHLQEHGYDTVEANEQLGFAADERSYGVAAAILHAKGIKEVDLLTNNPEKISQLEHLNIHVHQRIPLETKPTAEDLNYLKTKKHKFHHSLEEVN